MNKVLITGGSGLVGRKLTALLLEQNVEVHWLSTRKSAKADGVTIHYWNPAELHIDSNGLEDIDTVFNLAGANVAQRWTDTAKKLIMDSRVDSARTLYKYIENGSLKPTSLISASAVGYYRSDFDKEYVESDAPGDDFLSTVVQKWEAEVDRIAELNVRVAKLRIGIVLEVGGGALGQMLPVFKLGIGSPLGTGKQWMPWIHVQDLAALFMHIAQNESCSGTFNAGGINPVRNKEFGAILAKVLGKPYFFPPVPGFVLRLVLGEMARIALMSTKISQQKVLDSGFEYQYQTLEQAFTEILKK